MAQKTPVVYNEALQEYAPVATGDTLDSAFISKADMLSSDPQNVITLGSDGKLFVSVDKNVLSENPSNILHKDLVGKVLLQATDLVSSDAGNGLHLGTDQKLFTPGLSTDENNALRKGNDGGFFINARDLISTESMNPFCVDCKGKLRFDTSILPPPPRVVSDHKDNVLSEDDDGSAYLLLKDLTNDSCDNMLSVVTGLFFSLFAIGLIVSRLTGNQIVDDGYGRLYCAPLKFLVSKDVNNLTVLDEDGAILSKAALEIDQMENRLNLVNSNGDSISSVKLPEVAQANFLRHVELFEQAPGARPVLKMDFIIFNGEEESVLVDFDVVFPGWKTSGPGIYTDGRGNIRLSVDRTLNFPTASRVGVNCHAIAGYGLYVAKNPDDDDILAVNCGNGLFVNPDGKLTLNIDGEDKVVTFTDGKLGAAIQLRAQRNAGSGENFLLLKGKDDRSISSINLLNGLTATAIDEKMAITIATASEIHEGDQTPVNSDAVLSAIDSIVLRTDPVPTEGSTNPIQSGGVYDSVAGLERSLGAAVNDLIARIDRVGDFDDTPKEGSAKAVQSQGVKHFVDQKCSEIADDITEVQNQIAEINTWDIYRVRVDSDEAHPIYLTGILTAGEGASNSHLAVNSSVYEQEGELHARKFIGKVEASKIEGAVTATLLKSSSFESVTLEGERNKLVAPLAHDSYRIWGFARAVNMTSGETRDIYISGTYGRGATVLELREGFEFVATTGMDEGYSYRNLNVLPLALE